MAPDSNCTSIFLESSSDGSSSTTPICPCICPCILGGYASRRFFAGRRGFYHCCAFWVGTRPAVFTGRGGREKTAGRVPTQKARPGKKATRPRENRARRQKQRDAYPPRMQGLITNAIFRFAVVFYWPLHSGWVCVPPFFCRSARFLSLLCILGGYASRCFYWSPRL